MKKSLIILILVKCVCMCVLSAAVWDLLLLLFEPWQQLLFYVTTHKSEQTRISICEKHTSYVHCVCVCVPKESVCVRLRLRRKPLWILWNDNGNGGKCHRENWRNCRWKRERKQQWVLGFSSCCSCSTELIFCIKLWFSCTTTLGWTHGFFRLFFKHSAISQR